MARTMKAIVCNVCLVVLVLFYFIGLIIFHAGVGALVPAITDLPDNLFKGFGEVLRFDYLKVDSINVKSGAETIVQKCKYFSGGDGSDTTSTIPAVTFCTKTPEEQVKLLTKESNGEQVNANSADIDSTTENTKINTAFGSSLSIISSVANDKYLGTDELNDTAASLNKITEDMKSVAKVDSCVKLVPVYCGIYIASEELIAGVAKVDAEIDKFKNSDAMTMFQENSDDLDKLHILPYLFLVGFVFYAIFWWFGGTCCCCKGGSCPRTLLLIPHVLLCLITFIIVLVFVAIGFAWNEFVYPDVKVESVKGEPTVEMICVHMQDKFPEFWKTVFEELEDGLKSFFGGSCIIWVGMLALTVYEILVCLIQPYPPKGES